MGLFDWFARRPGLAEGLETTDTAAQEATWGELFDLLSEEVPLYPLFHRKAPTAWDSSTLVDFQPISLAGLSFVDVGTTQAPDRCVGACRTCGSPSPPPTATSTSSTGSTSGCVLARPWAWSASPAPASPWPASR